MVNGVGAELAGIARFIATRITAGGRPTKDVLIGRGKTGGYLDKIRVAQARRRLFFAAFQGKS